MARPIVRADQRCSAQIHVLLRPAQLEALDRARGEQTRSDVVREAVDAYLAALEQGVPA